jgi:hypothetical protein
MQQRIEQSGRPPARHGHMLRALREWHGSPSRPHDFDEVVFTPTKAWADLRIAPIASIVDTGASVRESLWPPMNADSLRFR